MHKFFTKVGLVTFAMLIALASIACNQTGGGNGSSTDNTVAATVNGKNIMLSEVEKLITQQTQGQQTQLSPLQLAQARLQVLDSLIQREVLYQRAQKENLLPNEEQITTAINQQKQQSGMSEEDFQKQLKQQNLTNEGLREEARKDIAIKNLQEKYNGKITISDREVEDYYNNNRQQFVSARGVALSVIIVDPADNSGQGIQNDAKNESEAKLKVDNVYQQLKSGADFATVARARSEDSDSLVRGGDIGFFSEERLKQTGFPKELTDQFMGSMQIGGFTEPRQISSRWYIFKLAERRLQNENLTLESPGVRQQITQSLVNAQKDILNGALLEVALSEAKVINNLAINMLNTPSNLGLRPASREGVPPAASPAAPAATPKPVSPSPEASASATPARKASPK
ncbi:MAG TPA: SurA N-terminal domain-containing protein [Pyrinomonadaceae bacterium]